MLCLLLASNSIWFIINNLIVSYLISYEPSLKGISETDTLQKIEVGKLHTL
jgi:hypothetical protein